MKNDLETLLNVQNVTVYRGKNPVLNRFSLQIRPGEHTVILGPNGAGKSTLLRVLSRDLFPAYDPQSIFEIMGEKLCNVFDLRRKMGIVSPELQSDIPGKMKVIDLLYSGFQGVYDVRAFRPFTDAEHQIVHHLLKRMQLEEIQTIRFDRLSSGQQRRALFARAVVHEQKLLIFDEPTTHLDLGGCYHYLQLMRHEIQRGATIVLVTHHLHEIPPEVKRVVFLKCGQVIADGPKEKTLTSTQISKLFDVAVKVRRHNGYYNAYYGHE